MRWFFDEIRNRHAHTQIQREAGAESKGLCKAHWREQCPRIQLGTGTEQADVDILASICNVLRVDPNELLDIRLNKDGLSEEEKQIISQYRKKPEVQYAVRVLLGIDKV